MPISYDKLWKLLIDKKMNRTDLKDASGISFNVLAKMGKNEFVSMESLHKICLTPQSRRRRPRLLPKTAGLPPP